MVARGDQHQPTLQSSRNYGNGASLVFGLPVDALRCRRPEKEIQVDVPGMSDEERTTETAAQVKACGNCLWGGLRARPTGWGITIVKCELDHTGRRIEYVCDDWDPKPFSTEKS